MDNYQQVLEDNMGNQYWRKKIQLKEARERGLADALTEQAKAAVSEDVYEAYERGQINEEQLNEFLGFLGRGIVKGLAKLGLKYGDDVVRGTTRRPSAVKDLFKVGKSGGKALFRTMARLAGPFLAQDIGSVIAANLERGDSVQGRLARKSEVKAYYEFNEMIYNQRPEIQEFVQAIIDFAATQGETLTVEDVLMLVAQGEYGIQGSYTNSILRLYNIAQGAARGDYPEYNPFRTFDDYYRTPKGGVGGPDDYPGPGGPPVPPPP